MKKLIAIVLMLAICLTALVACGQPNEPNPDGTGGTAGKMYALSYNLGDVNMSGLWKPGLQSAAEALDYEITIGDGNNDDNTAQQTLRGAAIENYDAYLLNVVNDKNGASYLNIVKNQNKPVIFWNRLVGQSVLDSYKKAYYVGIFAAEGGYYQGQMAAKYVNEVGFNTLDRNGDGKLGVLVVRGEQGHADAEARTQYAPMYLERNLTGGNPEANGKVSGTTYSYEGTKWNKVEVCGIVDGIGSIGGAAWDGNAAKEKVESFLSSDKKKEVDLILSNSDGMATGIMSGPNFKASGIPIWGVDATEAALAEIKKGNQSQFKGTVKNDGKAQAKVVVQLAYNLINGKDLKADLGKVVTTEAEWTSDSTAIWYNAETKCFFVHHAMIDKDTVANA